MKFFPSDNVNKIPESNLHHGQMGLALFPPLIYVFMQPKRFLYIYACKNRGVHMGKKIISHHCFFFNKKEECRKLVTQKTISYTCIELELYHIFVTNNKR